MQKWYLKVIHRDWLSAGQAHPLNWVPTHIIELLCFSIALDHLPGWTVTTGHQMVPVLWGDMANNGKSICSLLASVILSSRGVFVMFMCRVGGICIFLLADINLLLECRWHLFSMQVSAFSIFMMFLLMTRPSLFVLPEDWWIFMNVEWWLVCRVQSYSAEMLRYSFAFEHL